MTEVIRWPAAPGGRVLELGPAIDEFLASPHFAETTVVSYGRSPEALLNEALAAVDRSQHPTVWLGI